MQVQSDYPLSTGIRSIQRGTITVVNGSSVGQKTNTATVTAVDMNKSMLNYLGMESQGLSVAVGANFVGVRITLTNATTITATAYSNGASPGTIIVSYELVEFY